MPNSFTKEGTCVVCSIDTWVGPRTNKCEECYKEARRKQNSVYAKKRWANDSEWRERRKQKSIEYHRERIKKDPKYRERIRKYNKEIHEKNPHRKKCRVYNIKRTCSICGNEAWVSPKGKTCKECVADLGRKRSKKYANKNREHINKKAKEYAANKEKDADWVKIRNERARARARVRRKTDLEWKEHVNKQERDRNKVRRKTDLEWKERANKYAREYARKKREDTEYRQSDNAKRLANYHRNKRSKTKRILFNLLNIWTTRDWPYATAGKLDVCDMIMTELDYKGYNDLNFLSLPGNGREIHELIANGFALNYDESLGVDKYNVKALKEYFLSLFKKGELQGLLPIVRANIDELVINNEELPEFNAIHLDYNGPLIQSHIHATEAALTNNPDAIVAVTVQKHDRYKIAVDYTFGDFPFINMKPEILFYQPYKGRRGALMETYCFQNRR